MNLVARRHQGHRGLVPGSSADPEVRRAGRRRRGDPVLPLPRHLWAWARRACSSRTMRSDTPAGASLDNDQVLSQDAYGAKNEVTIGGASVPVPDLAVGRLVKTPDEIEATVDHYLHLDGRTLPLSGAGSSLVTGYDFLEDAANRVNQEFDAALPGRRPRHPHRGGRHAARGRPGPRPNCGPRCSASTTTSSTWPGTSAPTTRWRRTSTTTVAADELALDENADTFTDTLVLSAGCHSGYSIVEGEAVDHPGVAGLEPAVRPAAGAADRGHRLPVRRQRLPRVQRAALPRDRQAAAGGSGGGQPAAGRHRPGSRPREAGLPGLARHPPGHRPEGRAAGHALRPADDRLRRTRPGPGRQRGFAGCSVAEHDRSWPDPGPVDRRPPRRHPAQRPPVQAVDARPPRWACPAR